MMDNRKTSPGHWKQEQKSRNVKTNDSAMGCSGGFLFSCCAREPGTAHFPAQTPWEKTKSTGRSPWTWMETAMPPFSCRKN